MINRSFASGETKSKQHSKHLLQVKSIKSMTKEYKDFELKGFQKNIILGLLGIPETTQKETVPKSTNLPIQKYLKKKSFTRREWVDLHEKYFVKEKYKKEIKKSEEARLLYHKNNFSYAQAPMYPVGGTYQTLITLSKRTKVYVKVPPTIYSQTFGNAVLICTHPQLGYIISQRLDSNPKKLKKCIQQKLGGPKLSDKPQYILKYNTNAITGNDCLIFSSAKAVLQELLSSSYQSGYLLQRFIKSKTASARIKRCKLDFNHCKVYNVFKVEEEESERNNYLSQRDTGEKNKAGQMLGNILAKAFVTKVNNVKFVPQKTPNDYLNEDYDLSQHELAFKNFKNYCVSSIFNNIRLSLTRMGASIDVEKQSRYLWNILQRWVFGPKQQIITSLILDFLNDNHENMIFLQVYSFECEKKPEMVPYALSTVKPDSDLRCEGHFCQVKDEMYEGFHKYLYPYIREGVYKRTVLRKQIAEYEKEVQALNKGKLEFNLYRPFYTLVDELKLTFRAKSTEHAKKEYSSNLNNQYDSIEICPHCFFFYKMHRNKIERIKRMICIKPNLENIYRKRRSEWEDSDYKYLVTIYLEKEESIPITIMQEYTRAVSVTGRTKPAQSRSYSVLRIKKSPQNINTSPNKNLLEIPAYHVSPQASLRVIGSKEMRDKDKHSNNVNKSLSIETANYDSLMKEYDKMNRSYLTTSSPHKVDYIKYNKSNVQNINYNIMEKTNENAVEEIKNDEIFKEDSLRQLSPFYPKITSLKEIENRYGYVKYVKTKPYLPRIANKRGNMLLDTKINNKSFENINSFNYFEHNTNLQTE